MWRHKQLGFILLDFSCIKPPSLGVACVRVTHNYQPMGGLSLISMRALFELLTSQWDAVQFVRLACIWTWVWQKILSLTRLFPPYGVETNCALFWLKPPLSCVSLPSIGDKHTGRQIPVCHRGIRPAYVFGLFYRKEATHTSPIVRMHFLWHT